MPKGPSGQKRPADVTQNAVMVMRIATGQAADTAKTKTVAEESGSKGVKPARRNSVRRSVRRLLEKRQRRGGGRNKI